MSEGTTPTLIGFTPRTLLFDHGSSIELPASFDDLREVSSWPVPELRVMVRRGRRRRYGHLFYARFRGSARYYVERVIARLVDGINEL